MGTAEVLKCVNCHQVKPVSDFNVDSGCFSGYSLFCKDCESILRRSALSKEEMHSKMVQWGRQSYTAQRVQNVRKLRF